MVERYNFFLPLSFHARTADYATAMNIVFRARPCLLLILLLWLGLNAVSSQQAWPGMAVAWADDDDDDSAPSGGSSSAGGATGGATGGVSSSGTGSTGGGAGNAAALPGNLRGSLLGLLSGNGEFERQELLASGLSAAERGQLARAGYQVVAQRGSALLGKAVFRIKVPQGTSLAQGLDAIKQLAPRAQVDRNHFYYPNQAAGQASGACSGADCPASTLVGWASSPPCNIDVTIGMIDTGVDTAHESLRGQAIERLSVRSGERSVSGASHGTAIASLLVGRSGSPVAGLLPKARLLAVDAFHSGARQESRMDAFDFVAALDMLVQRGVKVINLSFAGPANRLMQESIERAVRRQVTLVAAVGNDGPMAAARFPAAYPQVLAVTAVRPDLQVFRHAVRGEHVSLAAPGVDLRVADAASPAGTRLESGTSFAVPFVTAAAAVLTSRGTASARGLSIRSQLERSSLDLGPSGFDPMYGHGLLQMAAICNHAKPARTAQTAAVTF